MRGAILIPIAAISLSCDNAPTRPEEFLTIEGVITDSESGEPIQGAIVDILTDSGSGPFCQATCSVVGGIFEVNQPRTDGMGRFAFPATTQVFCRSGDLDWYFEVTADGYQPLQTASGSIQCVNTTQIFSLQLSPL